MHRLAVLLLCLLFIPTPAAAQAPAAGQVLDDPLADGRYEIAGTRAADVPLAGVLDLTGLVIEEGPEAITFLIEHGQDDVEVPLHQSIDYTVTFRHGGAVYRLEVFRNMYLLAPVEEVAVHAWLDRLDGGTGEARRVASDLETGSGPTHTAASVPRESLMDERGARLTPGRTLEDFSVRSTGSFHEGPFVYPIVPAIASVAGMDDQVPEVLTRAVDRMPDEGNGTIGWDIRFGGEDAYFTSLTAEVPFHASNGEATTFVYELDAVNLRDVPDTYRLSVTGVPAAWEAWFPDPIVDLEPDEATQIGLVAHVPFAHKHGERVELTVRIESKTDPRYFAEQSVGVLYPKIAQPAGHHDTVWFHAIEQYNIQIRMEDGETIGALPRGLFYMNTAMDDDQDVDRAFATEYIDAEYRYGFELRLSPGLRMGIDVDGERTGALEATLSTEARDVIGAGLSGALLHRSPAGTVVLAEVVPETRADIGRDRPGVVTSTIVPKVEEPIDYRQGSSLVLVLTPDHQRGPEEDIYGVQFILHPGGKAVLPLEEYHADVSEALGLDPSLQIHVAEPEAVANPGDRVTFEAHVTNKGPRTEDIHLALRGPDAEAATVSPALLNGVAPGESRTVHVTATLPQTLRDGEAIDLILEASRGDDGRSLVRLLVRADTSREISPESAAGPEASSETPAPPTWPALLAAFWALRRRHRARESS